MRSKREREPAHNKRRRSWRRPSAGQSRELLAAQPLPPPPMPICNSTKITRCSACCYTRRLCPAALAAPGVRVLIRGNCSARLLACCTQTQSRTRWEALNSTTGSNVRGAVWAPAQGHAARMSPLALRSSEQRPAACSTTGESLAQVGSSPWPATAMTLKIIICWRELDGDALPYAARAWRPGDSYRNEAAAIAPCLSPNVQHLFDLW